MVFSLEVSPEFGRDYRKRSSKNRAFKAAVDGKVAQIRHVLETNPDH